MRLNKYLSGFLVLLLTAIGNISGAQEKTLSLEPEKVQKLMQRSKLLEGQIQVRQKNAQQRNDPNAKQYNIGYSDGYNKAVLDLLKSQLLTGVPANRPFTSAPNNKSRTVQVAPPVSAPATKSLAKDSLRSLAIKPPVTTSLTVIAPKIGPRVTKTPKKMPKAKAVAKTAPVRSPQKTFAELLLQSTKSLEAKNWSQAVSYASAALSLKPGSGNALINRSWAYAEQGMLHKALIDANESIRVLPNNALAYNNRAYTYDLLADLPRARKDYQRACELKFTNACAVVSKIDQLNQNQPEKITALLQQSQTKIKRKSWRGLETLSNKILMLDANNTEALVHRSWAYVEQGRLDEALTDANRAVLLSPNNALAYNNRAYTYELRNQLPKATEDYKKSCRLNYQPACVVVQKINQLNAKKKKTVTKAKKKEPSTIESLTSKTLVMFRQGKWHAVEQLSNKILALDPKNALAYVNRAGARTEMGLLYNALDDIKIALRLNPELGIAHNNKAYALERMGKMPRAAKSYKRACDLGVQQSCQDFRRINIRTTSNR